MGVPNGSISREKHFSDRASNGREMDSRTGTAKERAVHYEREATKFRQMAVAEPVEHIRKQLLAVAEQYQRLAESLNADRRLMT